MPGFELAAMLGAAAAMQPASPARDFLDASAQWIRCLETAAGTVPASITPEAGATQVIASCATQRRSYRERFEAFVATRPAAEQARLRNDDRAASAALPAGVAQIVRTSRTAAVASAAAAAAQETTRRLLLGRWRSADSTCDLGIVFEAGGRGRTHRGPFSGWSVSPGGQRVTIAENFDMPMQVITRDHVVFQRRSGPALVLHRCAAGGAGNQ